MGEKRRSIYMIFRIYYLPWVGNKLGICLGRWFVGVVFCNGSLRGRGGEIIYF